MGQERERGSKQNKNSRNKSLRNKACNGTQDFPYEDGVGVGVCHGNSGNYGLELTLSLMWSIHACFLPSGLGNVFNINKIQSWKGF